MDIIYDDIIYSLQKAGGISTYWQELEDKIPVTKRLVYPKRSENIFFKTRDREIELKPRSRCERYFNIGTRIINNSEAFIFHSSYYRFCKNRNALNITTIYDFNYEYYRRGLARLVHHFQKKRAIMKSKGVICISESTLDDLRKFFPKYKGLVKVIGLGYSKEYYCTSEKERQKRFLYVGSRNGYKNFKLAVEIVKAIPDATLSIVGGGKISKEDEALLNINIPQRYELLGYLDNSELAQLYNTSLGLLYTSDYEGFGIPALEAMACGCPVICQKKSSLPEVCGSAGVYITTDSKEAAAKVSKLLDEDFFTNFSEKSLQQSKLFSWEKTVKETEEFYNKVMETV